MQNTEVVHVKDVDRNDPTIVYIGRPSKWGNPFKVGRDGGRHTVVEKYRRWLVSQPALMDSLHELVGKKLACWCAPLECHGDVLAEVAEAQETYLEHINTERMNDR